MVEVRRLVRGESERLRIGYVASAVQEYLGPALARLRRQNPKAKVKMLDLTPGEQITARGKAAGPLRVLLDALTDTAGNQGMS